MENKPCRLIKVSSAAACHRVGLHIKGRMWDVQNLTWHEKRKYFLFCKETRVCYFVRNIRGQKKEWKEMFVCQMLQNVCKHKVRVKVIKDQLVQTRQDRSSTDIFASSWKACWGTSVVSGEEPEQLNEGLSGPYNKAPCSSFLADLQLTSATIMQEANVAVWRVQHRNIITRKLMETYEPNKTCVRITNACSSVFSSS